MEIIQMENSPMYGRGECILAAYIYVVNVTLSYKYIDF